MSHRLATLDDDVRAALKAGDKERLGTLRLLLGEVKNKRIEIGAEVDETTFLGLVQKAIKQRRESAEAFDGGGRPELAEKERREIEILEDYLPAQLGEDEIAARIAAFVEERGLSGPAAIGVVMKEMLPRFQGAADGATVSRLARQVLAGS